MYFWEIEYPWTQRRLEEFLGRSIFVCEEESYYEIFLNTQKPPCLKIALIPSQCGGLIMEGKEEWLSLAIEIARFFNYCFIFFNKEVVDVPAI